MGGRVPTGRGRGPTSLRLAIPLGVLALVRPVVRIVEDRADIENQPIVPIAVTIAITAVWVAVVGFNRVVDPVGTLVAAGLTYGVLSIILSGIMSPILLGHLEGPLAHPIAILPALLTNLVWGFIAGVFAHLLRRLTRRTRG
jgi:hypothetical protein